MSYRFHTCAAMATFSLAALPHAVQAQYAEPTTDIAALDPMVVTAALAPQTANESLSSVTVLDEATLRRQDPTSLTDLFRGQPGVEVTSNGSYGKSSSVYLRGAPSDASVLMIDGIRLRSATAGSAAFQYLDPRMFDRAEIVRGPRGSLYGADAVGGVIQLFTPEGEEEGLQPRFSVGGGSFDTQRLSAGISGREGGTRYSFAGSHFNTDGQPIRRGGEDKGYDNTSALARMSHTFEDGSEVGVLALRARGNNEYDGGENDFVQQVAGVYGELAITDTWQSRLTLSESRDVLDTIDEVSSSVIETRTHTARWQNNLQWGAHELIAGAEFSEDRVDNTSQSYTIDSRDNAAVFTQGLLDFSPLSLQASLRLDDNEAYGEEVTGSVALGYDIDDYHTLRASVGTAFKAPSFNDLYWPNSGNPELDPETSETVEVGLRGQYGQWFWDLAAFQNDYDDLIAWAPAGNSGLWVPQNVDSARIQGAELSSGVELDAWTLQAALTYLDAEDRATGNQLPRRASQSMRLDADYETGAWSYGGSLIAQNRRYDDASNDDRLGGYGLVNLRAGWQFAPMWSARVTVENAFDKEYETTRDYINAGRAAFLSVHFGQ
ncbi:MAG: TonB-dependent receptor domain-containing protein [Pseudomonadota bacterium]